MKKIKSVIFISWILILIGIVMDDLTSGILFNLGFEVLESNPIYLMTGSIFVMYIFSVLMYILLGYFIYYAVNRYRYHYINKNKGYKYYDIFVFIMCFVIIFTFIGKVGAGINNVTIMTKLSTDEGKLYYDSIIKQSEQLKKQDIVKYNNTMSEYYSSKVINIPYYQMLLVFILTYLLYRIEIKVGPWDLD